MASHPPIPPSSIITAQSNAKIDAIAVRIINLPDDIRGAPAPQKISGQVAGQNPDGTLTVHTERGMVQIMLRDRGNLPQGSVIDIDIPAGKNPQSATIRPQIAPPQNLATTLAQTAHALPPTSTPESLSTPRLNTSTLGTVLNNTQTTLITSENVLPPVASGALQAGQMLRLLPLSPNMLSTALLKGLTTPMDMASLISSLITVIEGLNKENTQLRTHLITLLSRINLASLGGGQQSQHPTAKPTAQPLSSLSSTPLGSIGPELLGKIDTLVRSIGLTPQNALSAQPASVASNTPQSIPTFNPSKPLDGQIVGITPSPHQSSGQNSDIHVHQPTSQPATAQPTTFTSAPVTPAQILGFDATGLPILSVPLPATGLSQLYSLQFRATNLGAGTALFMAIGPSSLKASPSLFTIDADGTIALPKNLLHIGLSSVFGTDATWDTLDALLKTMLHAGETQDAHALANTIPSPAHPQNLGALSLLFLAVLRTGAFDEWIPTTASTLLKNMGKLDALRAATGDMALASKLDSFTLPQDWRMTPLPLFWGQDINRTNLYYKHYPDTSEQDEDESTHKRRKLRFLFDLQLSRMGGVQVDGFMQSERLDLILRTKSPLSTPMQSQMKRLYAGVMDKSHLIGDLAFQFKPEHWVDFSKPFEKSGLLT